MQPAISKGSATAAGRGLPDLPLDGAAHPGWGPRPVDPEALASGELVRVAATLLAEDLVAMGVAEPTERPRRWRRRVQLAGDPLAVAHARAHLTAAGRLPGGPGARTVVLLASSEVMLSHLWTYRCFGRRVVRWSDWVGRQSARDRLPALLDPTRSVPSRTPPRAVRVITRPGGAHAVATHAIDGGAAATGGGGAPRMVESGHRPVGRRSRAQWLPCGRRRRGPRTSLRHPAARHGRL